MRKQFVISLSILAFLLLTTLLFVFYGKGYRIDLSQGRPSLSGTGLLVATSTPDGAEVYINSHLTTATNNTINLPPGEYTVRIQKQGYFPWEKRIKVQREVVAKAESLLFPTTPKLESITASGVESPTIDPSLTRIAYTVASASARKNGVYVLDMSSRPILTLQSAATQIADDTVDFLSKAGLVWSPDGQELLATVSGVLQTPTTYLLKANSLNASPHDVTATLGSVKSLWEQERKEKEDARLETVKSSLRKLIIEHFRVLVWSPDETKILYESSVSAQLPLIVSPRLIGVDATAEERNVKKGSVYVYDTKEDKNYSIDASLPLSWLPDSKHLLFVQDKRINIVEYDGTNVTTVYAGPFIDNYVFPWPNGSKILVLTNLGNSSIPPNLYTISLK